MFRRRKEEKEGKKENILDEVLGLGEKKKKGDMCIETDWRSSC